MLKIVLRRVGRKKLPIYHIIIKNNRKNLKKTINNKLGVYFPLKNYISVDIEKIKY